MASILSLFASAGSFLSTFWLVVKNLPAILKLIQEVRDGIQQAQDAKRTREELKRQEDMKKLGDKLKESVEARDEKATGDALDSIVDDYNRPS